VRVIRSNVSDFGDEDDSWDCDILIRADIRDAFSRNLYSSNVGFRLARTP
jgi:hypothetical protein